MLRFLRSSCVRCFLRLAAKIHLFRHKSITFNHFSFASLVSPTTLLGKPDRLLWNVRPNGGSTSSMASWECPTKRPLGFSDRASLECPTASWLSPTLFLGKPDRVGKARPKRPLELGFPDHTVGNVRPPRWVSPTELFGKPDQNGSQHTLFQHLAHGLNN